MKQIEKPFKPDVDFTVQFESATGRTQIKSNNGQAINPLFLCKIMAGIIDTNLRMMLDAQLQQMKGQPHKFLVLPGETKCRHPYCTEPQNSPVHVEEPPQIVTVQ